jgi:protein-disulfide isomerase/uncharacterized membrane protein
MSNDTFFRKATFNQKIIFFALGAIMAIVSIYLTSHYFSVKYPSGLEGASLCNINSFFNCDSTSLSLLGSVFGIPTALFGVIVGALVMLFYIHNNEEIEGTLYTVLFLNIIGCGVLFLYSIIGLQHLCPMCTVYYIASGFAFYFLHKIGENRTVNLKYIAVYGIFTLIVAGSSAATIKSWEAKKNQRGEQVVAMFKKLKNLGAPAKPSPFRLASATENFTDAPVQMSVFSDFQCPACDALNKVLPKIEAKYKGKINIQYFFYPLDHNCNPNMQRPMHDLACSAAYLAACAPKEMFHKLHDEIFANQRQLSKEWIESYGKKLNVTECMQKPETKQLVVDMINQADSFGVQSTPTQLLNGVKIEGVRPASDYFAIIDDILKNRK